MSIDADPGPLPPLQRNRNRRGHGSIYAIRRASRLRLAERVAIQARRDQLVHELAALDAQIVELTDQRRAVIDSLRDIRETLYPPVPWSHGRRPPDLDVAPLPPAAMRAEPLIGRALRAACLQILQRHGPTSLRDLHALLHRYGYLIGSPRPVGALSDAMRHEVNAGRARRVERGVYELNADPARRRRRSRSWQDLPPAELLARFLDAGRTPLDPVLDEDPNTWGFTSSSDPPEPHPDGVPPGGPHNLRGHGRC